MLDTILAFLASRDLGVLATADAAAPHCSLMAYVMTPDGHICMATLPDTRKWRNVLGNPEVSLLVDNRELLPALGRESLTAVTVTGRHTPFPDPAEDDAAKRLLAERHGHLGGILTRPEARIIRIRPTAYQLVEGPVRSRVMAAAPSGDRPA
ncbi:pyridoxamine 5'-phosphate oxidase family protein [Desulfovibrio sulfodismutans]|uniref:Pyridoxamine 5'-phosphate oxidase family protein n=1 Tax=Desulfolutivibrio sulfodismutans TaxID=63561 RepID=A0A7K3NP69_9BACT|nr:pyridoxamine 5'-phosphate oxidase family protein [Desulfolutivibrio sulfodismutans]NDY57986.1 pyridoxamine 5'-phosphate oxidase family protein [Desulfolutivibrio sulfodismutans]